MSTKSSKGNKGNLKASMAVGPMTAAEMLVMTPVVTETPSASMARQVGQDIVAASHGKRLHKRGWASM